MYSFMKHTCYSYPKHFKQEKSWIWVLSFARLHFWFILVPLLELLIILQLLLLLFEWFFDSFKVPFEYIRCWYWTLRSFLYHPYLCSWMHLILNLKVRGQVLPQSTMIVKILDLHVLKYVKLVLQSRSFEALISLLRSISSSILKCSLQF